MGRASGRLLYKYVLQRKKIKHKNTDRTLFSSHLGNNLQKAA